MNLETEAAVARRLRAAAPVGFVPAALGVPLDADFNPLIGGGAGPLFAGQPLCASMGSWSSDRGIIQNRQELKANVRAWFAEGGLGSQETPTRTPSIVRCSSPRSASFLLAPLFTGRPAARSITRPKYTLGTPTRLSYTANRARSTLASERISLTFGGSVSAFAKQHNVMHSGFGRGLQPVSEASLFSDPESIASNYHTVKEEPDAIVVEYTQLPNAVVPADPPVALERVIEVRFVSIQVGATGAMQLPHSPWRMSVQCEVNDQPQQDPLLFLDEQVRVGTIPTSFARQIRAHDGDTIECKVWGTYERMYTQHNLGPGSTGPIPVQEVGAPLNKELRGADANTDYAITWSATRLPN